MVISAITKMTAKVLIVRLSRAIAAKSARHFGKKQKPTKGSSAALFAARCYFQGHAAAHGLFGLRSSRRRCQPVVAASWLIGVTSLRKAGFADDHIAALVEPRYHSIGLYKVPAHIVFCFLDQRTGGLLKFSGEAWTIKR
jgi:hypothetical protein